MKLIDNWKAAWKFWSVKLAIVNAVLLSLVTAFPDAALQAWLVLPQEMKAIIPPAYLQVISIVLLVLTIIARVVKQNNAAPPPPPPPSNEDS